jgi:hypothetical protein
VSGSVQSDPASFRDPSGFVYRRDGVLYRQVNRRHRLHFDHLNASGLYARLIDERLLVAHSETDRDLAATDEAYVVVKPAMVPFVSYPYEWCFEMLRDAALATLRIQDIALDHGMSLRDASAYNILFHLGRPVFIDTTSFEIRAEGRPWVAYRQFCQHFLAPLALMAYRDVRLGRLLRVHLEGVPLDLASELMPPRSRVKAGLTMHLRMHARSQRKHEGDERSASRETFSERAFRGLVSSLRSTIEGLPGAHGTSAWRNYYEEAVHYSEDASRAKEQIVESWIRTVRPSSVWDLGANLGRFATIASSQGIPTMAFDIDPLCVDQLYRDARARGDEHILPLVQDLTNPSGGAGWAHRERTSLIERGPADLVLVLALIHHLAIANNVPLPMVCDLISRLGRNAIVEFVPKDDPKVQLLLRDREDVFPGYTQAAFEEAAAGSFAIRGREALGDSGRILYRLERR